MLATRWCWLELVTLVNTALGSREKFSKFDLSGEEYYFSVDQNICGELDDVEAELICHDGRGFACIADDENLTSLIGFASSHDCNRGLEVLQNRGRIWSIALTCKQDTDRFFHNSFEPVSRQVKQEVLTALADKILRFDGSTEQGEKTGLWGELLQSIAKFNEADLQSLLLCSGKNSVDLGVGLRHVAQYLSTVVKSMTDENRKDVTQMLASLDQDTSTLAMADLSEQERARVLGTASAQEKVITQQVKQHAPRQRGAGHPRNRRIAAPSYTPLRRRIGQQLIDFFLN